MLFARRTAAGNGASAHGENEASDMHIVEASLGFSYHSVKPIRPG